MTRRSNYKSFNEARTFARDLNLKTQKEWRIYVYTSATNLIKPADIPSDPEFYYRNVGWVHWGDWLGTRNVTFANRKWRPFRQARAFARRSGVNSRREWNNYSKGNLPDKGKRPLDVPANPAYVYKNNGWNGWKDWLGKS